ncbi:MAG: DNA adenine methylase [Candidatus Methanoperedens sp.]|nr:DNA adenine methylase [Candidatus Methanoperedens sp.]
MNLQLDINELISKTPTTRYRGSKRRVLPWLYKNLKTLKFDTLLDGFGGTSSVSYLCKMMGKEVTTNDVLQSNYQIGISLIENNKFVLNKKDIEFLTHTNGFEYPTFIQDTFKEIYYLDYENEWLDKVIYNILMLSEKYTGEILRKKRALAYNALFQACLSKRPYNLFHRKNLYMRTANVRRSFSNDITWDKPFDELFMKFCGEVSSKVFSNKRLNVALCNDIMELRNESYDLVYLDPPYIKAEKDDYVDYHTFYHFLEGIVDYNNWSERINHLKKNKPLIKNGSMWNKKNVESNLTKLFDNFSDSIIVISYGAPGFPSIKTIKELLEQFKDEIKITRKEYSYSLNHSSKNGNKLYEVLIIAR